MAADQWALILPNWTDKMQAASIRGRRINQAPLVLRERYLAKNAAGTIVETPAQLFWRVATDIAQAERRLQQFSACFVLPVKDSLTSIYNSLRHQALIEQQVFSRSSAHSC